MNSQCIVVANASQARVFIRPSPNDALVEVVTLSHPASRLKASALADDRPGHESSDKSYGGTRLEPRTNPRQKEHQRFAREIARRLEDGLAGNGFDTLWLFASDPFLGELKSQLGEALRHRLARTVSSDLTARSPGEIAQRMAALVAAPA